MRCGECAAKVAVTARVCSGCGAPIVGQPQVVADAAVSDTVVGAVTRRRREGHKGTNVAGVVLLCAFALVGIFFIVISVGLYVENRDLAAHGVRTQGEVVWADADYTDEVVFRVGGTDYWVPAPEVGDRLPGVAVTVVYDWSNAATDADTSRFPEPVSLSPLTSGTSCSSSTGIQIMIKPGVARRRQLPSRRG